MLTAEKKSFDRKTNNYPNLLPGENHGQLQNWVLFSAWDGSRLLRSPGAYMSPFYRRGDWGWWSERTYLPQVTELVHSLSLPSLQPASLITEEALPPSCWGPVQWGLGSSWVLWGPVRLETFPVARVQPDWSGYALIKPCWLQPTLPDLVYRACTQTHLRNFWELESFLRKAGSQRDHLRVESDSRWGLPPVRSFCVLPFHSPWAPLAREQRKKPLYYFLSVPWKKNIKNHFLCVQKMYQVSETCTYPDLFEKQLSKAGWAPSRKLCILYFI